MFLTVHRVEQGTQMKTNYNYKEKETLVRFHCHAYNQVKRSIQVKELIGEIHEESMGYDLAYVLTIDDVLHSLDQDAYRIIAHDFLEPAQKNWWMDYYAKTTYYRLKGRSMDAFLRCLHG